MISNSLCMTRGFFRSAALPGWRRRLQSGSAMAILTSLCACAGLLGPHDVNVPLQKLQAGLERKFPFSAHPLELIDIRLTDPRLALVPETNRMSATMNASVAPAFTQRVWRGTFTLSGTLELDAARHGVMLTQPRIDNIALDGVDPLVANQVARAAGVLAAQILRDSPLYTFGPDDFRYAGTRFAIGADVLGPLAGSVSPMGDDPEPGRKQGGPVARSTPSPRGWPRFPTSHRAPDPYRENTKAGRTIASNGNKSLTSR